MIALLWILGGVVLWMRTMRIYGRTEWFELALGRTKKLCPSVELRLFLHVLCAPVFLVAVLWYNIGWRLLTAIGVAATRFAEWYAPPALEDDE